MFGQEKLTWHSDRASSDQTRLPVAHISFISFATAERKVVSLPLKAATPREVHLHALGLCDPVTTADIRRAYLAQARKRSFRQKWLDSNNANVK